jgi:alkylation response protein AidB-like acyl-CoA dehydrogenase
MDIHFSDEQQALRDELRGYLKTLMTPALRKEILDEGPEGGGPRWREAMRRLGRDGWIGMGWPRKWGGRELGTLEQYIFIEEVARAGFPFPYLTCESVGPAVAEFGSDALKEKVLPAILAGELVCAIGYSEPGAGTDLAALKTTAVRHGNEYVINGNKVWTSLAHLADYVFLAVRTGGDDARLARHKGISVLMVPTDAPGFSHTPIITVGDVQTNATYYDNVRVPAENLVGAENGGWQVITSQLNRERVTLMNPGTATLMFESALSHARETAIDGARKLIDLPWVRQSLGEVYAGLEALRLACLRQAWGIAAGELAPHEASATKVYGAEFFTRAYRLLMEILDYGAVIKYGSTGQLLDGGLELIYRSAPVYGFGGGANEVQRDIIAQFGLGMPRAKR